MGLYQLRKDGEGHEKRADPGRGASVNIGKARKRRKESVAGSF